MACINGTVWCKGVGGGFASICPKCTSQKLATRQNAPVAVAPLPPALTNIMATATPTTVLAGRGMTGQTIHLGVGEQVDLMRGVVPPGFTVDWSLQGDAELDNTTTATPVLTAGATAGEVTVSLKISKGPGHIGHALKTLTFKVIAPSGTVTRHDPGSNKVRHAQGTAGVGFLMWINLLPDTVLFNRVEWREHTGVGRATGHFAFLENGRVHAPTGVPYNAASQPTDLRSADWMEVLGVEPAPEGINWVAQVDTVDTGDHQPEVGAAPPAPPLPPSWRVSSHKWDIEWMYRVRKASGEFSGEFRLQKAMHEATITADGTATISKAGCGPFSRPAGSPTSGYV